MKNKYIVFDLDDTLTQEIEFLKSAYYQIAEKINSNRQNEIYENMLELFRQKKNVFEALTEQFPELTIEHLLNTYRQHFPIIKLNEGAKELLDFCISKNYKIGLISDGRSITQRNKLKALGIEKFFDKIIISEEFGSEKPDLKNFEIFMKEAESFYYIANDTKKDFIAPNKLKWISICLEDRGDNIHKQDFTIDKLHLPNYRVSNLKEIISLI